MIVVAMDAPLDARQLGRVARRAVFALGMVGSDFAQGSGDYAIAFATPGVSGSPQEVADRDLDPLFVAVLEAVEEAVLNSLFLARTTHGHGGNVAHEVPLDEVRERLRRAS